MTMLIIGSAAANALLGDDKWRRPKDIDAFMTPDAEMKGWDVFWNEALHDIIPRGTVRWATLDELYTIKLSHIFWEGRNGKWNTHANDLMRLKAEGANVIEDMYKVLYGVWEKEFGRKQVDLDMDKADFFDDAVKRKWDHDSVHYSVAYGDHPLYEDFFKEGATIAMDMRKVWDAPSETQIRLFREEIYATALERKVIPSDYKCSAKQAYWWALRRVITSLTKGKSARFIAENLDIFRAPDVDYVRQHRENAHKLIPHTRKGN